MYKAVLQILHSTVRGGEERTPQFSSVLFSKPGFLMCVFYCCMYEIQGNDNMCVGKNRFIFVSSLFCGLFVDVEILFLSWYVFVFFSLTFSVHINTNQGI